MTFMLIGDSLAEGISQMIAAQNDSVIHKSIIQTGISARQLSLRDIPIQYEKYVISIGTNDRFSPSLYEDLLSIRKKLITKTVVWMAPPCVLDPNFDRHMTELENTITHIARQYNDSVVYWRDWTTEQNQKCSKKNRTTDGIHFTYEGYGEAAKRLQEVLKN